MQDSKKTKGIHKIFQKVPNDFFLKKTNDILHEFSLFQRVSSTSKPWFLRVYESFMVISKVFFFFSFVNREFRKRIFQK